jgi:hypothetical protein
VRQTTPQHKEQRRKNNTTVRGGFDRSLYFSTTGSITCNIYSVSRYRSATQYYFAASSSSATSSRLQSNLHTPPICNPSPVALRTPCKHRSAPVPSHHQATLKIVGQHEHQHQLVLNHHGVHPTPALALLRTQNQATVGRLLAAASMKCTTTMLRSLRWCGCAMLPPELPGVAQA